MTGQNMKRLGDYIRPVDVRNRDLKVNLSQGICNQKYFQNPKQVAENPETHKIVRTGQFAYNRATTRNGEKISIALREGPDCTVSSAYQVFEVIDENVLNSEYLMMWFRRPEFDRLAIYFSHGSAHEFFEWESMCEVQVPVPTIEKQREIVAEYNTLATRIETNKKLIATLEQTAQTGTIGDLGEMVSGATPSTTVPEYWCENGIPWISPADLSRTGLKFISRGAKDITKSGYDSASTWLLPKGSVLFSSRAPIGLMGIVVSELCTNQGFKSIVPNEKYGFGYVYYCLNSLKDKIASENTGSTFDEVSGERLKLYEVVLPEEKVTVEFQNAIEKIFNLQEKKENENIILDKMISVVLSKICC